MNWSSWLISDNTKWYNELSLFIKRPEYQQIIKMQNMLILGKNLGFAHRNVHLTYTIEPGL